MPRTRVEFDAHYHLTVVKWMVRAGLQEGEIAGRLGVSPGLLAAWRREFTLFDRVFKENKYWVDHLVEDALLRKALGYKTKERVVIKKPVTVEVERPESASKDLAPESYVEMRVAEERSVTKEVAPDVVACMFWLKNRDPDNWRDVLKHDFTGKDAETRKMEKKQVQRMLTDPESLELANRLARRVAEGVPAKR